MPAANPATRVPSRRPAHRRASGPGEILLRAAFAVTVVWALVVWLAPHIEVGPEIHRLALFCHLAALVVGFGAVLAVDWLGLRWMLRQLDLSTLLHLAGHAHLLIWLGLIGLVASGTLLGPDTSVTLTKVKLVAVLAVALNGLYIGRVQQRLAEYADRAPPLSLLMRGGAAAFISQVGWWTATVVGFISTQSS